MAAAHTRTHRYSNAHNMSTLAVYKQISTYCCDSTPAPCPFLASLYYLLSWNKYSLWIVSLEVVVFPGKEKKISRRSQAMFSSGRRAVRDTLQQSSQLLAVNLRLHHRLKPHSALQSSRRAYCPGQVGLNSSSGKERI